MPEKEGRLSVGIIGAGRVGPVIGAALAGAGHLIDSISAVSPQSVDRATALLPGVPIRPVPDVVTSAELVVLAVPDGELAGLVDGLAAIDAWRPGQILVHTSPSFGIGVLEPAQRSGAIPVALHPAMAFTGTSLDLARLRETRIAVTAPGPVLPIGQALAVELGGEPVVIPEESRAVYAEAIASSTTYSGEIVAQALRLLVSAGVDEPGRMLGPLLHSAIDNAVSDSSNFTLGVLPREDSMS